MLEDKMNNAASAPVPAEEEELRLKWYGTADIPELTFPPIASYPVITLRVSEETLTATFPPIVVVTLPAGEAALLTRIAEVAVEYSISHNYDKRKELFRLAKEWRKWSRDNR